MSDYELHNNNIKFKTDSDNFTHVQSGRRWRFGYDFTFPIPCIIVALDMAIMNTWHNGDTYLQVRLKITAQIHKNLLYQACVLCRYDWNTCFLSVYKTLSQNNLPLVLNISFLSSLAVIHLYFLLPPLNIIFCYSACLPMSHLQHLCFIFKSSFCKLKPELK